MTKWNFNFQPWDDDDDYDDYHEDSEWPGDQGYSRYGDGTGHGDGRGEGGGDETRAQPYLAIPREEP
jgi:hypothetical protein